MIEFFKINDTVISPPKEIQHSFESLDKAERTMNGTMVIDIVGKKRKIDVKWENLSKPAMSIITAETEKNNFVRVSFHDAVSGKLIDMITRVESISYSPGYDWTKQQVKWLALTITFVEK